LDDRRALTADRAGPEVRRLNQLIAVFSDADWADFDGLVARGYDPLFGTTIEKYYKTLHQRILNIAA
jgi:hypothetical protein